MLFEFELNGVKYQYDAEKESAINTDNILEELSRHPGKVAFISAVASIFRTQVERKKVEMEAQYAKLDSQIRRAAFANGEKTTEKGIESAVLTNPNYTELGKEYLDLVEKSRLAESCMETMRHRQFALVAIVGMMKTELSSVAIEAMKAH